MPQMPENINYDTPERFKHLINQADFNWFIHYILKYAERNNKVFVFENDHIVDKTDTNVGEIQKGLDTLIRVLAMHEKEDWPDLVSEHFGKLEKVEELVEQLNDFESIKNHLTIRIYPKYIVSQFGNNYKEQLISRVDFKGTISLLCVDLPNKFATLNRENTKDWNVSNEDLFSIAQKNIATKYDKLPVESRTIENITISHCFERDYAVSYIIDFQNNCKELIGIFGTVVSIPSKGAVLLHPINGNTVMKSISIMAAATENIYRNDEGPITLDFYWYYKGKFHLFESKESEQARTITIPYQLIELLSAKLN